MAEAIVSIIGGSNIGVNIQQTVNTYINTTINQTFNLMRDSVKKAVDLQRSITHSGIIGISKGGTLLSSFTGKSLTSIMKEGFKGMYKILKDIVVSEKGVLLAVMVYRTIDVYVPCDKKPFNDTIDNIIKKIDEINISIPYIDLPHIDLSFVRNKIHQWFTKAKSSLQKFENLVLNEPEKPEKPAIECVDPGSPPDWYNVSGWITYIGQWIMYAICRMASSIAWFYQWVFYGFQYFIYLWGRLQFWWLENLVSFTETIINGILSIIEIVANAILWLIKNFINLILSGVNWIVNNVILLFFKLPIKFFLGVVVRNAISLIVDVFKWIKDNVKSILCYYLHMSPYIGFYSGLKTGFSKAGILGGLLGGMAGMFGNLVLVNSMIPECSPMNTGLPPSATLEEVANATGIAPSTPEVEAVPRTFTTEVSIGLWISDDGGVPSIGRIFNTSVSLGVELEEFAGSVHTIIYSGEADISIETEEERTVNVS